ncbi:hypothetical protein BK133_23030 [Paenibacillus sp. FSL H8-0548]|uniref:DUF3775 domain-containing protein n=1 Tax=Paenibacillus sp. FSL H8-0548 TaxID=1920422 RepID=UPI00096C319F|nr:DUF3775 domain-containing protein [Paenibacillus sp. FSL H8-0548]OMF24416.1 hypothetical protein BK133_23030 [Paenibacillus sp. FSL H8-0548]
MFTIQALNDFLPKIHEVIRQTENLAQANKKTKNDTSYQYSELFNYVDTFDDNEIAMIQTLMYIGRDESKTKYGNKTELFNLCARKLGFERGVPINNRENEITQMIGKESTLYQYLKSGLDILIY